MNSGEETKTFNATRKSSFETAKGVPPAVYPVQGGEGYPCPAWEVFLDRTWGYPQERTKEKAFVFNSICFLVAGNKSDIHRQYKLHRAYGLTV